MSTAAAIPARAARRRARWWTVARVLLAFILAPRAGAGWALLYLVVVDWYAAILGLLLAYVLSGAASVVGYLVLLVLRWRRPWEYAAVGFALGAIPLVLNAISWTLRGAAWEGLGDPLPMFFPPAGATTAVLFWFVAFWRNAYCASE